MTAQKPASNRNFTALLSSSPQGLQSYVSMAPSFPLTKEAIEGLMQFLLETPAESLPLPKIFLPIKNYPNFLKEIRCSKLFVIGHKNLK